VIRIQSCVQWLKQQKVESVAMESTGVYWIPVLEILENSGLETLLVDTRPLSRVPGPKRDVEDCPWIQTLHSHGLQQLLEPFPTRVVLARLGEIHSAADEFSGGRVG